MAFQATHDRERTMIRLQGEIACQQDTIEKLQLEGQSCPDARRQLERLKDSLALLK